MIDLEGQFETSHSYSELFMAKASTKMTTETQTMLTAIYYCRLMLLFVTIYKLSFPA